MARVIVIRITVDNREAINAIRAQREAQRLLNDQLRHNQQQAQSAATANARLTAIQQSQSHVQQGLTNSFIKGNIAARAISATYLTLRDSVHYVIGESLKLEHNLAKVSAVTGTTGANLDSLSETVFKLSRNTAVSTNMISETALELAKLGFEGKTLEVVLGGVAQLSSVLGDSLEATGQLVGGVIQTFNLSNEEAAKVADKLFVATGKSASNVEGFKVAFSLAGSAARDAGVSFEEFAAVTAALSNQGIRASTIGTGLRNLFIRMSIDGSAAAKALGGSIQELGLLGVMERLASLKLDPGSLFDLFGKPGLPVASGLGNATEQYKEFLDEVERGEGVLNNAKSVINDTLISQMQLFKNSLVEVTSFFTKDFLTGFTQALKGMSESLNDFAQGSKDKTEFTRFVIGKKTQAEATKALGLPSSANDSEMFEAFMANKRLIAEEKARKEKFDRIAKELESVPERGSEDIVAGKKTGVKTRTVDDMLADFERLKTDFEVFQTFGGPFDFGKTIKEMDNLAHALLRIGERQDAVKVMREIQDIRKQADKTEKATLNLPQAFEEDAPRIIEDDPKKFERFLKGKERFEKNQEKEKKKLLEADQFKMFVANIQASFEPVQILIDNLTVSMNALGASTQLFGDYIVESFLGHADAFSNFQDSFGNLAKRFVSDMIAMTMRILAFKAAMALVNLFTGGPPLPNLPGAPDLANMPMTLAANGFDGIVNRPRLFLAGEGGEPERVKITPMSKMGAEGGSGVTNIYVQGDVFDSEKLVDKVALTNERTRTRYV